MSVFNFRTKKEPIEALRAEVARISKCLKTLKFWEVNDIGQGSNILKRRKVTPSPQRGVVGRGPWNEVTGLNFEEGGGGAMDYSGFAFGFSVNKAVMTVKSGKVRYGTRTAVTATGKDITIAADQTWIFVAYTFGSTATITSSTSEPVDTEEVHNHALYLVTLSAGGTASVGAGNIRSLGDIFIPGSFA